MIAIIDYDTGNLRSVENALHRLGAEYTLTADPSILGKADKILLPGVGEASSAMSRLHATGLDSVIPQLTQPVLGICIGMQLMCRHSEENDTVCMGIFDTDVCRFDAHNGLKVPHMGWNTITGLQTPLFKGISENSYVYYVHSYAPDICSQTIATTEYGKRFSGALRCRNFYGTQFHPEKSGSSGAEILKNFLDL